MSDTLRTDGKAYDHLPITKHTFVLGVDICVNMRADAAAQDGKRLPGGLKAEPGIETPTDFRFRHTRVRRGLAVWARRNLFDGAEPGGGR